MFLGTLRPASSHGQSRPALPGPATCHYVHRRADDDGEPLCIVHRDVSPSNVLIGIDGVGRIADFGIARALQIARLLHVLMIVSLGMLVWQLHLGVLAIVGIAAVAGLLLYEHGIVKPNDLSRVNAAFFTMNGWVSVLFFVFWAADVWYARRGV